MSETPSFKNPEFDAFADNYDEAVQKGLSVSGEKKEFFAQGRVNWLAMKLNALRFVPRRVLDFGCGTGTAAPFLLTLPGAKHVVGVEVSPKSVEVARRLHGSSNVEFSLCEDRQPAADIDFAYCSGVFHHIPPSGRDIAFAYVFNSLRPGGIFAFCENNPWNPGTRYIMSRIEFDRDAITISPPEARRLLRRAGFNILRQDSLFFFPAFLKFLRGLEPSLAKIPFGAQYMVLVQKPAN